MPTIKIVLRKKPDSNGDLPLCLRITKNGKPRYIYLGPYIPEGDWDKQAQSVKRSHTNHVQLNKFLLNKLTGATNTALDSEVKDAAISAQAIKEKLKPVSGPTFLAQAQDYLDSLKAAGDYNQHSSNKSRVKHFKEFMKGKDIAFQDISKRVLEKFVSWMKTTYEPKRCKKKRISDRTIANHLITIRSVFAHARKNKVIDKTVTAFGEDGMEIKIPESTKVGISEADIERLEKVELSDPAHDDARKKWLFSFYFAGMRASDLFRLSWGDIRNGRLYYIMGKNKKVVSLKIPDKAADILEHYKQFRQNVDDLVFPELKGVDFSDVYNTKKEIAKAVSKTDRALRLYVSKAAEITGKVSLHIARHTFASIAGDKIPVQTLQKLYRHSDIRITIAYQANFMHKEADDALDVVLNGARTSPKPE